MSEVNIPAEVNEQVTLEGLTPQTSEIMCKIMTTDQEAHTDHTGGIALEQEKKRTHGERNGGETTDGHVERRPAKQQKPRAVYKRTYTYNQPQRRATSKRQQRGGLRPKTTESSSQTDLCGEENIEQRKTNESSRTSQNTLMEQAGPWTGTPPPALKRPPSGQNEKHGDTHNRGRTLTLPLKQKSSIESVEPQENLTEWTPPIQTPEDTTSVTPAATLKALIKVILNTTSAMMKYIVDLPEAEDISHLLHRLQTTLTTTSTQATTQHAAEP